MRGFKLFFYIYFLFFCVEEACDGVGWGGQGWEGRGRRWNEMVGKGWERVVKLSLPL